MGILKFLGNVTLWIFHAERISACTRTIICNKCEHNNMIGEILNAFDNVDDQDHFGFTGS